MVGELAELSLAREPFPHTQTRREWPRVLVMGQDLPHLGRAGSIILYRLFEDWPSDKLLALGPTVEGETRLACSFRLIEPVLGRWDFSRAARAVRFLRGLGVLRSRMLPLVDWKPQVEPTGMQRLDYVCRRNSSRHSRYVTAYLEPLCILIGVSRSFPGQRRTVPN